MSGLLGQIIGGVLGGGQQGQPSAIAGILHQVLAAQDGKGGGGVADLVSRFQAAGLGQQAQSWVGTGANQPISGNDIEQVFSPQQVQDWAQQAGTTPDAMKAVLAQALPHVVDHMTPGGQIPSQSQTPDLSSLLGSLLGGAGATRRT